MLTAIALDDEKPALEVIEAFCNRIDFINLQKTFSKTAEAHRFLAEFPVDLLFLDINMPAQTGVDFARSIVGNATSAMVIFTTAHSEYAVESYELNAVDYLLKPFTFERFEQAVQKANDYYRLLHQSDQTTHTQLVLRADYSLVNVTVADILFVEGLDNYLKIHLVNRKLVIVRLTMKALLDKLPAREFVRVHRSYIVPIGKIQSVRNKLITIGDNEIPLGSRYEGDFYAVFGK